MATDLHTLNTVLGAAIEEQVVRTLNLTRSTWDPDGRYALYSFVRQAQTFPDVLLRRIAGEEILLGIELKGWYLARTALERLRRKVEGAVNLPTPKARSALAIISELEGLLDLQD